MKLSIRPCLPTAAVLFLSVTHRQADGAPSTPKTTCDSPEAGWCQTQLNWHLQGSDASTPSPLVTVQDVLPAELLEAVVEEIEGGMEEGDCVLRRDGLRCNEERWLDLTVEDVKSMETSRGRDIFEQAVIEISRYDLLNILPPNVSKHVKGVSWRILAWYSGHTEEAMFHYDSDEDTDYVLGEEDGMPPLIHPLLSTVAYLTDHGEPTVILEQGQVLSEAADYSESGLYPCNAYVSMPKANKHLAFDARLFHGASAPVSKNPGEMRLVIGMNFHTQKSMETGNEKDFNDDEAVKPFELPRMEEREAKVMPWRAEDVIMMEKRDETDKWEGFEVYTFKGGYDYCRNLAPCKLTLKLPIERLLADEKDEKKAGATVGYALSPDDFAVEAISRPQMKRAVRKFRHGLLDDKDAHAINIATSMLQHRCKIFDHELLSMNPPLNQNACNADNS